MERTQINPEILQPVLESATNAAQKGQAQFFTPLSLAQRLAEDLPAHRPTLCDLSCGAGHLLHGCANESTRNLLGCDVDTCRGQRVEGARQCVERITGDLTLIFPLLCEIGWHGDLFVLNPPWDLHWHRERLQALGQSEVAAVREAFAGLDPRLSATAIDSGAATLMMALDRCTWRGEGLMLWNNATLRRLVLDPGAPHAALKRHLWLVRLIDGNPCLSRPKAVAPYTRKLALDQTSTSKSENSFQIAAVYFALDHDTGPAEIGGPRTGVRGLRRGADVAGHWQAYTDSLRLWHAVVGEWRVRSGDKPPPFNLYLNCDGTIGVHLSLFAQEIHPDKEQAARLFALRGKHPMRLVLQRDTRRQLLDQLLVWKVCPKLRAAVDEAVRDYHAARAPLYPLPETQRIGHLDEEDEIECRRNLTVRRNGSPLVRFKSGQRYKLDSKAVAVERKTTRENLEGKAEELLLTGQELLILVHGDGGTVSFTSAPKLVAEPDAKQLRVLLDHFVIPDVPDVARLQPEAYEKNLAALGQLESLTENAAPLRAPVPRFGESEIQRYNG